MSSGGTTVHECPPEGSDFDSVLRLLKSAKKTVGFLPDGAVRERAERGTLLVTRQESDVTGYVLYDLPRNEVRIVQLVVAKDVRRSGTARLLVERVAERHPARQGIVLECRRDFEAADVWPKLGFAPVHERAGRGRQRRPLTTWRRDFGHPDLFTVGGGNDERPIAALDANIVIDLAEAAETPSRHLTTDWVAGACRLAVTDEVYVEVERRESADDRVRHKRFAQGLDQLRASAETWRGVESSIESALGGRAALYASDIRHAAKAAASGARWLVTRDDRFRRACSEEIEQVSGLAIVMPAGLILELDRLVRDDLYRPADLAGSDVEIRALGPGEFDAVARAFVNQPEGERLRDLRATLGTLAADAHGTRASVYAVGDELLALAVVTVTPFGSDVAVCRVRRGRTAETLARHVLGWLRTSSGSDGLLAVTDRLCGAAVRRASRAEGFFESEHGPVGFVVTGIGDLANLQQKVSRLARKLPSDQALADVAEQVRQATAVPKSAFDLERVFFPYIVIGADLPTFLVPIKPAWASELVDASLSRQQLFRRSTALALQREHVYYRSPRAAGGLSAPGRIVWYVSGGGSGGKAIRAISHLDEVVVGDARRLFRRFSHLGVYSEPQVLASADANGKVMALRFSGTRPLDQAVSLDDYRRLMRQERPGVGFTMAGPQRLPEHMFDTIARMTP